MLQYDLLFHGVIAYFICFYKEALTKLNYRKEQTVLVAHNGTRFDIRFLFEKWNTEMLFQTLVFLFHLETLTLAKSELKNIPPNPKFKTKLFLSSSQ